VFIDSLVTIDESELKSEKILADIQEVITLYIELFLKWVTLVPSVADWATPWSMNKLLHLVNPEAAIWRLGASFIQNLHLIFGQND